MMGFCGAGRGGTTGGERSVGVSGGGLRVPGGGGMPQLRHGGMAEVVVKFEGYGLENVQYVQIQPLCGGAGGFVDDGAVVSCILKCRVIFGDDLRNPALH